MLAARLADRGFSVTGLERERWSAGEFPSSVDLVIADLHHGIPQVSQRFDYILCADVLEHLLENAKVLRQLNTLLKPGGRLITSLPNSGNIYFRLVVLSGRFPKEEKGLFDHTHVHFHPWSGWQSLLEVNGYTIEKVGTTPIPFSLVLGDESWLGRAAEKAFWRISLLWKSLFAYQFIVTARAAHE